jgi:phenylacetate-coenzyme A ligase PaaK-like adenylate-forming protein
MALIVFSTGSTNEPKPVVYTEKDLKRFHDHTWEWVKIQQWPDGVRYNMWPYVPHVASYALYDIATREPDLHITLPMVEDRLEKFVYLFQRFKPVLIAGLPRHVQKVISMANSGDLEELKMIQMGSDTMEPELFNEIRSICPNKIRFISAYGATEFKQIFFTCKEFDSGYHIDVGSFRLGNNELVYTGGELKDYHTGDTGRLTTEPCPYCGFKGQRLFDTRRIKGEKKYKY